jgi:ribonuclease D
VGPSGSCTPPPRTSPAWPRSGCDPVQLFDTELAARLLGMPRVGLAAVVEHYLGLVLAKEHSAADWSKRPLPLDWLRYAALDVEVLGEIRNLMGVDLAMQWQVASGPARSSMPSSRGLPPCGSIPGGAPRGCMLRQGSTRGGHGARTLATPETGSPPSETSHRALDPRRLLVAIAKHAAPPPGTCPPATGPSIAISATGWARSIGRIGCPSDDLPPVNLPSDGPPPPRAWAEKNPVAADRLGAHPGRLQRVRRGQHGHPRSRTSAPPSRCGGSSGRRPPGAPHQEAFAEALASYGVRPLATRHRGPDAHAGLPRGRREASRVSRLTRQTPPAKRLLS